MHSDRLIRFCRNRRRANEEGQRPESSSISIVLPCLGLLLHVTSLPSSYGIGDVGPAAIAWIHQLSDAGQSWWQALPLGPTGNAEENPWRRWIDTALDSPHDILEWAKAEPLHDINTGPIRARWLCFTGKCLERFF